MEHRPIARPTPLTQGFWDAAQRDELVVQRCDGCTTLRHYPQPLCPECHGAEWSWQPLSGRGHIYTYTTSHRAFHPYWTDRTPYVIATIELAEGVRMVSDLPAGDTERVGIGLPVEVFFEPVDAGDGAPVRLPRFRLVTR